MRPRTFARSIGNRTVTEPRMRPPAVGSRHTQRDFVGSRCVSAHHGQGVEMIERLGFVIVIERYVDRNTNSSDFVVGRNQRLAATDCGTQELAQLRADHRPCHPNTGRFPTASAKRLSRRRYTRIHGCLSNGRNAADPRTQRLQDTGLQCLHVRFWKPARWPYLDASRSQCRADNLSRPWC